MEKQEEKETTKEALIEKEKTQIGGSREPFFGALLFFVMIFFTVISLVGIGMVVYTQWKESRAEKAEPSIVALSKEMTSVDDAANTETETPKEEEKPKEESPAASSIVETASAKALSVAVLNGGAVKGSAGVLAEALKKKEYKKVTAGNTTKDYVGVTVYYEANREKEAGAVIEDIKDVYANAKSAPAESGNKETLIGQITIIVGK